MRETAAMIRHAVLRCLMAALMALPWAAAAHDLGVARGQLQEMEGGRYRPVRLSRSAHLSCPQDARDATGRLRSARISAPCATSLHARRNRSPRAMCCACRGPARG